MYNCSPSPLSLSLTNRYSTILHDCLQCYVSQRKLLLSPSLVVSLAELTTHHKSECCTLVSTGFMLL